MSVPYKCPVCGGAGKVPKRTDNDGITVTCDVVCHACDGKGVVWSPESGAAPALPLPGHPFGQPPYPMWELAHWIIPWGPYHAIQWHVTPTCCAVEASGGAPT